MKRIIAFLLCLVMVISVCPVSTFAVATEPNVTLTVNKTEVNVGDTITVTLGVTEMTASSVAFGFDFDTELVSVARINTRNCYLTYEAYDPDFDEYYDVNVSPSEMSTLEEANEDGHIGIVFASGREYDYKTNAKMVVITLTALASGTVEFKMFEDSAGPDGYKDEWTHETTVIIGGSSEPECDHSSTKLVPNADGKTHNVVCTNEACNGYVVRTENCSGTDDGDHTTAVMCACGNTVTAATEHTYTQNLRGTQKSAGDCVTKAVYAVKCDYCAHESDTLTVEGEYGDHAYGDLIPAQEAIHNETELNPAVAAHYHCSKCGKYFTEGKVETTIEALTGETPVHTEGEPVKNTEESTDATCTEGGTLVEDIFCSECGKFIRKITTPVAATCTTGTVEYTWGTDNATCKAQLICEHGEVLKEETVTTTSKVTTEATCVTAKVVTYYADFTADWAKDQSLPVTGEKNPDVHYGDGKLGSYKDNGDGTHSFICGPCGQPTGETGSHDKAGYVHHPGNCRVPETVGCSKCPAVIEYSTNPDVHAANGTACVDNGDGATHTVKWPCCDEVVKDAETHDYTTGTADNTCICGAAEPVELVEVTVYFIYAMPYGDGIEVDEEDAADGTFYHTFYANPDEDLVVDVKPMGDWPYVGYCIRDDGGVTDERIYADGVTQLVVPTEWFDYEDRWIEVYGHSYDVIDLNGGALGEGFPENMLDGYDSATNILKAEASEGTSWTLAMWYAVGFFEREGYTLVGAESGETTFGMEDDIEAVPEGRSLKLIWKADHVCTHDHYKYIGSTTGHVSVCSCGEELGYPEGHELGENDLCVCGAWLFTMDYNGGKSSEEPGKDSYEFYEEPGYVYNFTWNEEYCKEVYTKEGYVFAGYAYDAEGQNPVVNPTELSSTTTVYVVWACNHDQDVYEYTYTDNRDGTHTVKCACGETLETTEPHDYTTGTSAHTCACEAVEKFTLSFDLNGGTLADEYGEFEAYIQDGKFILPDIEYGALIQYNRFYQEGWLVKEGYHITGFEDEDGNFHSLESDDVFTMTGATTLTVIWEVNEYTLTVNVRATGELVDLTVPYGANLLEVLAAAAEDGKIPALGEKIRVNNADQNGENIPYQYSYYVDDDEEPGWIAVDENFTMPAEDFAIAQDHGQNGWVFSDFGDGRVGAEYCVFEDGYLGSGWHYIDENYDDVEGGAWYYFAEGTGVWAGGWFFRVEGLTRVPYPTEPINGWTYAADADALAYDPSFIDKDEAWFLFDEDGKFQYDTNGDIGWYEINDANELRYMNHGMLEWHPGLIKNGDDYYYFIGDVVNGGNIAAEGDTWITRGNDVEGFTEGHIYNFAEGKLSGADGIVDGKYYENSRLMAGNGLTKIQVEGETKFIYVRSNGELVVNNEYYVPANDKGVVPGTYAFDENGYLINPELTGKDGIYWENGAWYYYENGKICYNKGLIEVTETWYDGEGTVEMTGVIYVRSNGQLAMGYYYVTNMANYNGSAAIASGTKLLFDNYGALAAAMNGIVDGYYYQNNQIVYGAGVVEIEEGKYIYVKSDGTVVMNRNYWITNVGDTGVVAKLYTFDENGYFTPEFVADQKDGIVDGYYYENGAIAYGKGLIEYNGGLIYVRSNGQVATGKYWITTTNGLKESGYYTFGEDGMMIN